MILPTTSLTIYNVKFWKHIYAALVQWTCLGAGSGVGFGGLCSKFTYNSIPLFSQNCQIFPNDGLLFSHYSTKIEKSSCSYIANNTFLIADLLTPNKHPYALGTYARGLPSYLPSLPCIPTFPIVGWVACRGCCRGQEGAQPLLAFE